MVFQNVFFSISAQSGTVPTSEPTRIQAEESLRRLASQRLLAARTQAEEV